jgi:hypothetical protein
LLPILWILTVAAVVVAGVAHVRTRRLTKRLERLTESYWELRYEHGQLKAQVTRLDPEHPGAGTAGGSPAPAAGTTAFVPLSSLKTVPHGK